jgi:hypothetical protein
MGQTQHQASSYEFPQQLAKGPAPLIPIAQVCCMIFSILLMLELLG